MSWMDATTDGGDEACFMCGTALVMAEPYTLSCPFCDGRMFDDQDVLTEARRAGACQMLNREYPNIAEEYIAEAESQEGVEYWLQFGDLDDLRDDADTYKANR